MIFLNDTERARIDQAPPEFRELLSLNPYTLYWDHVLCALVKCSPDRLDGRPDHRKDFP